MKIIDKLTIGQRLMLMTLVFLLPAGVMLFLIASTINKDINFAVWERYGNAYQRPIQKILEAKTEYAWAKIEGRDASSYVGAIDSDFDELMAAQKAYGEALQVTPEGLSSRQRDAYAPEKLLARWQAIKSAGAFVPADLVALATDLKGLLGHTGDTSNLILDPDLDSYYLMDITLLALPQTQGRLMTTQFDVADLLAKESLTEQERVKLAVIAAMFAESDRARTQADTQVVLNEDKNFYGVSDTLQKEWPKTIEEYAAASTALEEALAGVGSGGTLPVAKFTELARKLNTVSFATWQNSVDELDTLLTARIKAFEQKRLVYISMALVALAAAVALAIYLSGTIRGVLANVMQVLSRNAGLVAQASQHMQVQAREVASATQEQISSIESTVAFMEEISSIIKQNESHAKDSRENALRALNTAGECKSNTEELAKSTLAVDNIMTEMNVAMSDIKSSSQNIANILHTIDEIAFQTNILALNAAVEAARAGEAGAGFSVVADEVRKLAHRSSQAAEETSKLIKTSIEKTESGYNANTQVSSQLKVIAQKTQEVSANLQKALDQIIPLDQKMEHVAQAAAEQSQGVDQLAVSVDKIEQMTKANVANSTELEKASQMLQAQYRDLRDALAKLSTLTGTPMEAEDSALASQVVRPHSATSQQASRRHDLTFK
jgi:hypothetical protein